MIRPRFFINVIIISFLIACNSEEVSSNEIDKSKTADQTIQQGTVVSLNATDWKTKLQEMPGTIIDIRTPDEWRGGYIEAAYFVNLFDQDFVTQVNKIHIEKNNPLYIYCRSGNRSKEAMKILEEKGYTQIYELNKGILGWQKEGFEITK